MSWTDDPVADFDRYDAEQQQFTTMTIGFVENVRLNFG